VGHADGLRRARGTGGEEQEVEVVRLRACAEGDGISEGEAREVGVGVGVEDPVGGDAEVEAVEQGPAAGLTSSAPGKPAR
jgi:hypothetical protein